MKLLAIVAFVLMSGCIQRECTATIDEPPPHEKIQYWTFYINGEIAFYTKKIKNVFTCYDGDCIDVTATNYLCDPSQQLRNCESPKSIKICFPALRAI